MTSRFTLSLVFLLAISTSTVATEAKIGELVLNVPSQFKGPASSTPAADTRIVGYTTGDDSGKPGTVLQVTRLLADGPPPAMSEAETTRMTSRYVLEMLAGVERRRTDFARTSPEVLRLGGLLASKVTWTGKMNGLPMNGAMYCVIVGNELVTLHAFGPGESPDPSTSQAISAIQNLKVASPTSN